MCDCSSRGSNGGDPLILTRPISLESRDHRNSRATTSCPLIISVKRHLNSSGATYARVFHPPDMCSEHDNIIRLSHSCRGQWEIRSFALSLTPMSFFSFLSLLLLALSPTLSLSAFSAPTKPSGHLATHRLRTGVVCVHGL